MSPFSRPVLLPSLVLCSPVLLDAWNGATTWTDALDRFLLVLAICWVAVSVVHALAFSPTVPASPPGRDGADDADAEADLPGGPRPTGS